MPSIIEDTGSEHVPFADIFSCWALDEKKGNCDWIDMIYEVDEYATQAEFIPKTPERVESPIDVTTKERTVLKDLMKRYPNFVPARLSRVPKKRSRPVCLFVNYMGMREDESSMAMEPTAYPTDPPSLGSNKKHRIYDDSSPEGKEGTRKRCPKSTTTTGT